MGEHIGKAALLEAFCPTDVVELPSGRGSVKVRGLTRWEAVQTQQGVDVEDDSASLLLERRALAIGMVDPSLTEDEVEAWQQSTVAADVATVAKRISELSALDKPAGKGPTSHSRRTKG